MDKALLDGLSHNEKRLLLALDERGGSATTADLVSGGAFSVEVEADQIPLGMKLLFDLLRNSCITAERLLIPAERTVKLLEEQVHDGDNVCGILTRRQTLSETSCYNCFDHVLSGGAFHRRSG